MKTIYYNTIPDSNVIPEKYVIGAYYGVHQIAIVNNKETNLSEVIRILEKNEDGTYKAERISSPKIDLDLENVSVDDWRTSKIFTETPPKFKIGDLLDVNEVHVLVSEHEYNSIIKVEVLDVIFMWGVLHYSLVCDAKDESSNVKKIHLIVK